MMCMRSGSEENSLLNSFQNHFTMLCMFPFTWLKEWLIIFFLCGCFLSMACSMYCIPVFQANGNTYYQTGGHSKKHGWLFYMICIFAKACLRMPNTMLHSVLLIPRSF